MEYILILLGFVMLFIGGENFVMSSVAISHRLRISSAIIGIIIVGFGTSIPELLFSIFATINDKPSLAVGNIIGSNIFNIALILGVCSVVSPIIINNFDIMKRDALVMIGATILLLAVSYFGQMTLYLGLLFLAFLGIYLYYMYQYEMKFHQIQFDDDIASDIPIWSNFFKVIIGLILLIFGAFFLTQGASTVARELGVSEAIIGLTMITFGISLPELVASVVAVYRKQSGILLGNIIGGNIFNILFVLGFTAVIQPYSIDSYFLSIAIPLALLTALSVGLFVFLKLPINRYIGTLYILGYSAYITGLFYIV